jgi:hypothetical protein
VFPVASLLGLPADDWSAIAAWLTAAVAIAAAVAALRQVAEARRLRAEQAQPYVVAYLEESGVSRFIDLVIRNLGSTAATDVQISMEPEPERALARGDGNFSPLLPKAFPVLVPGQEWRTLFDTTMARAESDLPKRYDARVRFKDARGRECFEFTYVLDWSLMIDRASVTIYGIHDIAKAVRDMSKVVARWKEGAGSKGIAVYVRDGDARDARMKAQLSDGDSRDPDATRGGAFAAVRRHLPRRLRRSLGGDR